MNSICIRGRKTVVCKLCGNIRLISLAVQRQSVMDMIFMEQIERERQGYCENPSILPFIRG